MLAFSMTDTAYQFRIYKLPPPLTKLKVLKLVFVNTIISLNLYERIN
jgi:hypothetical protein